VASAGSGPAGAERCAMPRTEERPKGSTQWDLDPYAVEPTLTLVEWRRHREQPFVEIVTRHDDRSLN